MVPSLALVVQVVASIALFGVAVEERAEDNGLLKEDGMCTVTTPSNSGEAFALGVG